MNKDESQARLPLLFTEMGGAGELACSECDFLGEITSFTHGFPSDSIPVRSGYQCQSCGVLATLKNERRAIVRGKCGCGGDLARDQPIFCPRCKSDKVEYTMTYIT